MRVAVVIPWDDRGCPYRRRNFEFVHWYWTKFAEVLDGRDGPRASGTWVGHYHGPDPFSRAAAINAGVRDLDPADGEVRYPADVILQADPDSLVKPAAAREALALAAAAPGLVVAFDRYRYLDEPSSAAIVRDRRIPPDPLTVEEEGTGGVGNVVAFSRETWETVGGYDERFGTWGADDSAFAVATGALCGPLRRVPGDMLHLWHPRLPESAPGHPEYERSMRLAHEYHAAAETGPDAMRALVAANVRAAAERDRIRAGE